MKSLINISCILCINKFLGNINMSLSNSYRTLVAGRGTFIEKKKKERLWLRDTEPRVTGAAMGQDEIFTCKVCELESCCFLLRSSHSMDHLPVVSLEIW